MTQMQEMTLPTAKAVREVLTDLIGRTVNLKETDSWHPRGKEWGAVAEYVDRGLQLRVAVVLDFALSVYAGAAIGLLPPGGAQDMVDEHDAPQSLLDNLYEVLNIMTSIFNGPDRVHVKITTMHGPDDRLPVEISSLADRIAGRLDLEVDIPGYGGGRLAFILV